MRALFVLPFATFDAPKWVRDALLTRALATINGTCACGATYERTELRPGELHTPAMVHEGDCAAADPRLESAALLPEWVELHAIGVDLPDEAVV